MPKGDKYILKADPEDGTTPISNLLLEAVAMAKLSGLQKGAILYLWRQTYGWQSRGSRLKERKIPLSAWVRALNATKARVSEALNGLVAKNIFRRVQAGNWQGYTYSMNTDVSKWDHNCIDTELLSKTATVAQNGTVPKRETVAQKGDGTVSQNGTEQLSIQETPPDTISDMPKEILKKIKEKEGRKQVSSSPEENKQVREIFGALKERRGYNSPNRSAEAKAIGWMLKEGYTSSDILGCHDDLKSELFWQNKSLTMMSVKKQVGEWKKSSESGEQNERWRVR
jgi:phage replication O-like protein O